MGIPPIIVAVGFLIAVVASLVLMAYVAWKGSKPSPFFTDAVKSWYDMDLPEADIDAYYDLKEKLQREYAPEVFEETPEDEQDEALRPPQDRWVLKLPPEDRGNLQKALMKRLVSSIEILDRVHRDKPGNWKLWREKLVSERYWSSLCDAEKLVGEEIDCCVAEADDIEPGWKDHIFRQAVQYWRMQKQAQVEKKVQKKAKDDTKKQKEREERAKEQEAKKAVEDQERQERLAQKMMEKLLKEEEMEAKAKKGKDGGGAKAKAKGRIGPASGKKK